MALSLHDVRCDPIANRALNELMHHYTVAQEKSRLVLTKKTGDMQLFLNDLDDLHQWVVRMSVTSGMPRSSAIWQSGSILITPPDRVSRRLFETRSSKKSGTRLIASIKESRPAARRRDQLRRPDEAIRRSARPCNDAHAARAEILLEQHAFSRQAVPFRLTQSRISVPSPHGRRGRAPKTPTLLDVLWVMWGRLKLQNHQRSLPRVLDSNLRVTASPTRVLLGVASCQSEILSLKKAVWRLWPVSKSRTMSSAEGCEQLLRRVASVARPPSLPSRARTALSRTICGRI